MIDNVAIIANPKSEGVLFALQDLLRYLEPYDINLIFEKKAGELLGKPFCDHSDISSKADAIIVLGGDGTMLMAAGIAYDNQIPILGFHMGRLGFITPFYQTELPDVIERMFKGYLSIQKLMRLTCTIEREGNIIFKSSALNEVTIMKGGLAKMTYFDIFIGDSLMKSYKADGFIVSTPTGSTGYSLSAGGPIVEPDNEIFILTPICPHSMDSRTILVSSERRVRIRLSEEQQDIFISKDGIIGMKLQYGDTLEIRKSKYSTHVYSDTHRNFYDHLKSKFGWGSQ